MKSLILVCCLFAVACGTPQITMPVGTAAVMYGNARADYAVGKLIVTQACVSGKLDADTCKMAADIDVKAIVYKDAIEKALLNPSQPVDWGQVMAYSETVVGLLIKLGLTAVK